MEKWLLAGTEWKPAGNRIKAVNHIFPCDLKETFSTNLLLTPRLPSWKRSRLSQSFSSLPRQLGQVSYVVSVLGNAGLPKYGKHFSLTGYLKELIHITSSLPPFRLSNEMREQVRACLESIMFNCDEVHGTPGGLMVHTLPSPFSLLSHILLLLTWGVSPVFAPSRPRARFSPCSHKHFDYLSSSTSSGKIIMSFHELLQMDCDFDLMICNNGVQDFAVSATGLEQESFPARAHRSITPHASWVNWTLQDEQEASSIFLLKHHCPQPQHMPSFWKN